MSDEIYHNYLTGSTLYACRFQLDGNVFITDGSSDEVWGAGASDADTYDVTMTEDGDGGHYVGDFDTSGNITTSGPYRVSVYLQVGGSPADSDPVLAQGEIFWGGTSEVTVLTVSSEDSKVNNVYGPGE